MTNDHSSRHTGRPLDAAALSEPGVSAPAFEMIDGRTKENQVAAYIREGIISGRFPRGAHLKQQEIADSLKLSITPVREALKLLEAEGYLTAGSYRGSTVAPFDPSTSEEILHLRITLESQLFAAAARKITTDQIAAIKAMADDFERAASAHESIAARALNYRLHFFMYEIAELPQTLHFVQVLWARYPFDLIHGISGRVSRAAEEHTALLNQLIQGDLSGAMLTMRQHIEQGWSELRDHLKKTDTANATKNSTRSIRKIAR
jgi:DNA-binding GntR family transcriptional regulator